MGRPFIASWVGPKYRFTTTLGLSLLFHLIALLVYRDHRDGFGGRAPTTFTFADSHVEASRVQPMTLPSSAPRGVDAAAATRAAGSALRSHHARRAAAATFAPARSAEPLPSGQDDGSVADDSSRVELPAEAESSSEGGEAETQTATAQPIEAAADATQPAPPKAASAVASTVNVSGAGFTTAGDSVARPAWLVPGSCTEQLEYPSSAMLHGKEGVVHMIISLDEHGNVLQAKLSSRAGFGLDEAALEAVKTRCRFAPARDASGHAVSVLIDQVFSFRIGDFR